MLDLIGTSKQSWRHQAIEASAGTGKTYTIENLMVNLLKLPPAQLPGNSKGRLQLSEVLVVTFTEKAAGELRQRIRNKIASEIVELQKADSPDLELLRHYESCLNRFDEAAIHTIHGFCKKYLDSFAFEGRMTMQMELRDERELVQELIQKHIREGGLDTLPQQVSRMLLGGGPDALIRIVQDVLCGTTSDQEVIYPYGGKPKEIKAPKWSDLISLCEELLKLDKISNSKLEPSRKELLRHLLGSSSLEDWWPTLPSDTAKALSNTVIKAFDKATDGALTIRIREAEEYRANNVANAWYGFISACRTKFKVYKEGLGVLTFSDMISSMASELAKPESLLLQALRGKFRFGLIDEFQDTNALQWSIFRRIFIEDQPKQLQRVLWLVGDKKQSIFSFQTADVKTCEEAMHLIAPTGRVNLDHNYRSSPSMIESYNSLFAQENWFSDYPMVKAGKKESDFPLPYQPSQVPWGRAATVYLDLKSMESGPAKKRALVAQVTQAIVHLVRHQGVPESDICVLFEKNKEMALLLDALRSHGIRASKGGETGLFRSEECLQVIHLLQAIDEPNQVVAFRKVVLGPFLNGNLQELWNNLESESYWEPFRELLQGWQALAMRGQYENCFYRVVQDSKLYERLSGVEGGLRAIAAYRQIFGYALRNLRERNLSLLQLMERLRTLYRGEDSETEEENTFHRESSQDAVKLMTLHKSKGLEFPIVFMCTGFGGENNKVSTWRVRTEQGFCIAISPVPDSIKDEANRQKVQERKRLWYVGLTRAKLLQFVPLWGKTKQESKCTATWFLNEAIEKNLQAPLDSVCILQPDEMLGLSLESKEHTQPSVVHNDTALSGLSMEALAQAKVTERRRRQTSYTSLASHGGSHGTGASPYVLADGRRLGTDDESVHWEDLSKEQRKELWATNLPAGADTGNALHSLFEELDFETIGACSDVDAMLALPGVKDEIETQFKRNRLWAGDTEVRMRRAAEIVWNTLRAKIPDPVTGELFSLCEIPAASRRAELEYHFRFGPDGKAFETNAGAVMAGTVFGFMDLVFERQGRYYVLDWKSNTLFDYEAPQVAQAMQDNEYTLQAALYGGAMQQFLQTLPGKAEFGGAIYVFLRGAKESSTNAVWTSGRDELLAAWDSIENRLRILAQGGRNA